MAHRIVGLGGTPLLALLACLACAGDASSSGPAYDVGGVEWTIAPDLRIGNSEKPEEIITDITGLKISNDRTIFVMQPRDRVVRVFDGAGKWLRNIGREGQGPGEFTGFGFFGFNADSLWVTDPTQNRVSLFGMNGLFIRYLTAAVKPPDDRYAASPPLAYLSNGSLLVRFRPKDELEAALRPPDLIMRASSAGDLLDTVRVFDLRRTVPTFVNEGREFPYLQPISDLPYLVMAADGSQAVIVERTMPKNPDSAAFTVLRVGPDGNTISQTRYRYTPRRVPQSIVDSLVPLLPDSAPEAARDRAKARRERTYFPAHLPPVNKTIVGRDGTLWLANDWGIDRYRWTIVDENDRIIAHTTLPRGFRLLQADRDYVWGSEADSNDVPYVVRYKLVKPE